MTEVRKCTPDDIEWLMKIGLEKYGGLIKDADHTKKWLLSIFSNPKAIVIRTDDAAMVVTCAARFFDPLPLAAAPFFAGKLWDMPKLFIAAKNWAKGLGARELHFRSTTTYDIAPLAKRIGAKIDSPNYCMRL